MIVTTTSIVQGQTVEEYVGVVTGESMHGVGAGRSFPGGIRGIFGGSSEAYEKMLRRACEIAMDDMEKSATSLGANAVIGVNLNYETVGATMLMVMASGTAVRLANG